MEIKLNHSFLKKCHNLPELLIGCNKLSTFCNRLEKQATLFPDRYDPDKYKGDGFELFVEALIKLSPIDNRIGIGNYEPIQTGDTGVDGVGVGINNKKATVQVKYRSNHNQVLTANTDHLSNFVMSSALHEKIDVEDKNNMLIITTAKGLHHFTEKEMFINKVRCIGYEDLRNLVDNNELFWDKFRELCSVK